MMNPTPISLRFNPEIIYTKNLFGTVDELRTSKLYLMEKNSSGDCLCIAKSENKEEYIVSIDHRDIAMILVSAENTPSVANTLKMVGEMVAELSMRQPNELYCGDCPQLSLNEYQQRELQRATNELKPHMCLLLNKQLMHNGQPVNLMRHPECPLNKGGQQSET